MTEERPTLVASPSSIRILLTVEEAAKSLGIGRTTMYSLVRSGGVESVLIGRLRRIPPAALDTYVRTLRPRPSLEGDAA